LILEGDNLDKLFPSTKFNIGKLMIRCFNCSSYNFAYNMVTELGLATYVAIGGALSSLIVVCCVLWSGIIDGVGFHEKRTLVNWRGILTALSLYVFCYGSHPVFPTMYTSMRDRTIVLQSK